MEEWDDINIKESHKNKPLSKHISEVRSIVKDFFNFYNFPFEFWEVIDYIIEYHDYGKLNRKWRIDNECNPNHAPLSIKYLKCSKKLKEISEKKKKLTWVLLYLILKHHSFLGKNVNDPELKLLPQETKNVISRQDFNFRINLIDAYGFFKIADVCSAEGKQPKLEAPLFTDNDVKRIISNKLDLDSKRWLEQQQLINLPDQALLRAYTGWGKTDVSLLFFRDRKVKKIFYLFPTLTAINKFYNKLKNVFNDKVIKYFYLFDTEVKDEIETLQNMFFIQNFMAPYVITTVDQFLLSFLQVGKYFNKRLMFRKSGIVLDEVHLLNPIMLELIAYFLKKYQQMYNFKVLFMSATLPESLRTYLSKKLALNANAFLDFANGYKTRRRIQFEYKHYNIENAIDDIVKKFDNGKRVLVMLNTVEKAVKVAQKISDLISVKNIILLHSRFMYKDRKSKERKIDQVNRAGYPHVLVSTQVCEVSLDVSYECMFTELAPVPSLIQRFGRVNRYGKKTDKTNVLIFKPTIENEKYYPYVMDDIKIAEDTTKELEGEKLKNEMDLLQKLDTIYTYEIFQSIIEKEGKKVNLNYFEEFLQFFFSLSVDEKELEELLGYRESFTTMVIPAPISIEDRMLRKEVNKLMKEDFRNKNFDERMKLIAELKDVSVPVPIYWMKGVEFEEKKAFPVVRFNDKIYNCDYGFIEYGGETIL